MPRRGKPLLAKCGGIEKSFPGVRALSGVSFDVAPGEVHALLGENGAGKSTLIKIVSGVFQPDSGSIRVDGRELRFERPDDARRAGIATIYQELLLFPELTVAENIFMGHAPQDGARPARLAGDARERPRRCSRSLDIHDLAADADRRRALRWQSPTCRNLARAVARRAPAHHGRADRRADRI